MLPLDVFRLGNPTRLVGLGLLPPPTALASIPLLHSVAGPTPGTVGNVPAPTAIASNPPSVHQIAPPVVAPGLSLSPATAPFPQKLVDKVRSGQFVDMRDLLTDNVSLLQQLETFGGHCSVPALPGALKPRLQEIATLPSWLYCFLAYVALKAEDPGVRDMLAYARLLIREAQRHGGNGWLDYDRVFRQQAAIDHTLRWNSLHPGIQASTLVGCASGPVTFCTLCREPDHTAELCALSYLQSPASLLPPTPSTAIPPVTSLRPRVPFKRRPESLAGICVSWNKGRCSFPNFCKYRHVCATCQQYHMARDCATTPADSEYKIVGQYPVRGQPTPYSRPRHLL